VGGRKLKEGGREAEGGGSFCRWLGGDVEGEEEDKVEGEGSHELNKMRTRESSESALLSRLRIPSGTKQ